MKRKNVELKYFMLENIALDGDFFESKIRAAKLNNLPEKTTNEFGCAIFDCS